MSDGKQFRREEALEIGGAVVDGLRGVCERFEVAGSVRRRKALVGDLEVVCMPQVVRVEEVDLFGPTGRVLEKNSVSAWAEKLPGGWGLVKGGEKYKQLVHIESGLKVDVFTANRRNWGVIFAIRTGDGDFSKALVTRARQMGMLVTGGYLHDHWLEHIDERGACRFGEGCTDILTMGEEADFFRKLGLPWMEPWERDAGRVWVERRR